jgi:GntR family transcriptional regulator, rspAB operon transcriptional repressor
MAALALDLSQSTESIARQVSRALRHAIVTMRIRPGEMLSEQDLAGQLGVSRQPVREAFIKLGEAGLVRILPQRGTLVVKISRNAVEDARFIREAVECAVAREAARLARPAQITAMRDCLVQQRRAARARDAEAFFTLDEEFHRLLAEAAERPSAWRVVEDVKAQMDRVRFLNMSESIPMRTVIAQHDAIAEAIKAGDPDAAEAAMRAHLTEILRSLPAVAAKYPEIFDDAASHSHVFRAKAM